MPDSDVEVEDQLHVDSPTYSSSEGIPDCEGLSHIFDTEDRVYRHLPADSEPSWYQCIEQPCRFTLARQLPEEDSARLPPWSYTFVGFEHLIDLPFYPVSDDTESSLSSSTPDPTPTLPPLIDVTHVTPEFDNYIGQLVLVSDIMSELKPDSIAKLAAASGYPQHLENTLFHNDHNHNIM